MPRLNRQFQVFLDGPTGGPVLGDKWPFSPQIVPGYRVRLTQNVARGATLIPVDVFAGDETGSPVENGTVALAIAAGTRINIGDSLYSLSEAPAEWLAATGVGDTEIIWDPKDYHGQGTKPDTLTSGGFTFVVTGTGGALPGDDPITGRGDDEARLGITRNAAFVARSAGTVRSSARRVANEDIIPNLFPYTAGSTDTPPENWISQAQYDLGSIYDGFVDAPNHKHAMRADGLEPDFSCLDWAGHTPQQGPTNLRDGFDTKKPVLIYTRGPELNDLRTIEYWGYASTRFSRFVRSVPDSVNAATLTHTEATDYWGVYHHHSPHVADTRNVPPRSGRITIPIGGDALSREGGFGNAFLRYRDEILSFQQLAATYAGVSDITVVLDRNEHFSSAGSIWRGHHHVKQVQITWDDDASTEMVWVLMLKDASDNSEFVSQAELAALTGAYLPAIEEYFQGFGEALYTRRFHALRFPNADVEQSPLIPFSANNVYRLISPTHPIDLTEVVIPDESPAFERLRKLCFTGSPTVEESVLLGPRPDDEEDGGGPFVPDLPILLTQIFPTEYLDPGNQQFIGSGGIRRRDEDRYTLVLAPTYVIEGGATSRVLVLDRPLSTEFAKGTIIGIVERIIPPSDDTKTIWGALADFRTRNEVVAGLDDSGNVEQQQTVDRAMFEVRAAGNINAGMYLRDDAGRLWEIIGVADHLRNRRNVVLVCERVFDRRRRPTTFPRFAVPIRRV